MYNDTQCITVYCGTKLETMVMLINHRMIGMPATKYENIKRNLLEQYKFP